MADNVLDRFKENTEEKAEIDVSKKVKVGIIGTGWIAEAHVANYLRCPDVEIVAAADLVPGKAEKFCKANGIEGIRLYPDHKSMIDAEELDAVSVCTYNRTHAECSIYALEHGTHVLVEKPASVAAKNVREMNEVALAHPELTFGIMFNQRTNPLYIKVRELIQSGELGEIRRSNWIVNSWWRPNSGACRL